MRFLWSLPFLFFALLLVYSSSIVDASSSGSVSSASVSGSSAFPRHQFVSRSVGVLEALEDYSIIAGGRHLRSAGDSEWTHHWQKHQYLHAMNNGQFDEQNYLPLIDAQAKNNNNHNNNKHHAMSVNNDALPRFRAEGSNWVEPFPASISASFRVFGTDYHYELKLNRELFSEDAALIVDEKHSYKHMRATYTAGHDEVGSINDIYPSWVVMTLELDGRFTARISKNGTVLQIDPTKVHIDDIESGTEHHMRVKDAKYNPHQMLAFYLKDRTFIPVSQIFRPKGVNGTSTANAPTGMIIDSDAPLPTPAPSQSSAGANGAGRRLLMSRWTNCFPNDSNGVRRRLFLGVAMDVGHYRIVGNSATAASNAITTTVATLNNVFGTQINVEFVVGDTSVRSQLDNDEWNNLRDTEGGSCDDMNKVLAQFTAWRRDVKSVTNNPQGMWHLFGACNYGGGIAGVANICLNVGCSLSNWYPAHWQTAAHELGHNFGAWHPFDSNTSTTGTWGGIMDYGDHRIRGSDDPFANQGEVAFASTKNTNPQTIKEQICTHVGQALAGTNPDYGWTKRLALSQCWAPAPTTTTPPPTTKAPATTTKAPSSTTPTPVTTKAPSTTTPAPTTIATTAAPASKFAIYWKSHQDRVVDINDAINADGTAVKFWTPNGANGGPGGAQFFEWVNGEQLRWVGTDKCLDISEEKNVNLTPVLLWTCGSSKANQKFVRVGDQIQWKGTDKCFDVLNGQYTPAGTGLVIYTCDSNNANQQFLLK